MCEKFAYFAKTAAQAKRSLDSSEIYPNIFNTYTNSGEHTAGHREGQTTYITRVACPGETPGNLLVPQTALWPRRDASDRPPPAP